MRGWRLVCDDCVRGEEVKCIGILVHPDLNCAACGKKIREHERDTNGRFNPVMPLQLERIRADKVLGSSK